MYEIGYILMNRSSIFVISAIIFPGSAGTVMVYFITYSGIMVDTMLSLLDVTEETATGFNKVLIAKEAWIILLGIIMLPVVLKKELQELHIVSVSLFVSMITFIFSLFVQLCTYGTAKFPK